MIHDHAQEFPENIWEPKTEIQNKNNDIKVGMIPYKPSSLEQQR